MLKDPRIDKLTSLIKDTFRVRPNQDPLYVPIGNHLERLIAKQHQVIFGRRGSGKSCLLVHYHRTRKKSDRVLSVYLETDEVKTLRYPDILIRLLLSIGDELRSASPRSITRFFRRGPARLNNELRMLRALLDEAEVAEVSREVGERSSSSAGVRLGAGGTTVDAGLFAEEAARRTTAFTSKKIENLERHLKDYKSALVEALRESRFEHIAVIVDDFYLIDAHRQPDVIDYMHRLLRGTDFYLKVGTVRHRTALVRHEGSQTVGVELAQDVEEINLDQTFEDIDATRRYLTRMLDSMAAKVGLEDLSQSGVISDDALLQLTLASGGVPRDFLNIFVEAVNAARDNGWKRLTPKSIYKGAGRVSYRTKLTSLREDAGTEATGLEKVLSDLTTYCLKEKRKTAFLVSQDDATTYKDVHELIQQLMDFKLIHVIEPDTSAASGRPGRYEAYALDLSLFMEPRLRNIEHVEFWKIDEQRRRRGLREAPVYSLERANGLLSGGNVQSVEQAISNIRAEEVISDFDEPESDDE